MFLRSLSPWGERLIYVIAPPGSSIHPCSFSSKQTEDTGFPSSAAASRAPPQAVSMSSPPIPGPAPCPLRATGHAQRRLQTTLIQGHPALRRQRFVLEAELNADAFTPLPRNPRGRSPGPAVWAREGCSAWQSPRAPLPGPGHRHACQVSRLPLEPQVRTGPPRLPWPWPVPQGMGWIPPAGPKTTLALLTPSQNQEAASCRG